VHHAFLFTGTRGVGKTTIARILARSLNCERGVSSRPCGECGACREIDEGRFVDLIEVDAASRTKVDDTRELLENVQYLPTRGRFKVYLIDEVHMLSAHSFNALLKTLEEPPPHVKFLLATTDPQKLPVTVLSRCLQFNLKRLPASLIATRLTHILAAEGIAFEPAAVSLLARAADGSLRDALSLLDQMLAFGAGRVAEADARAMLGTVDRQQVLALADRLAERDARGCSRRWRRSTSTRPTTDSCSTRSPRCCRKWPCTRPCPGLPRTRRIRRRRSRHWLRACLRRTCNSRSSLRSSAAATSSSHPIRAPGSR
jgi:DNA polymerase-3 subunit gamma/tau